MRPAIQHLMQPLILGLCPVCWFCILAIVILAICFIRLLRGRKDQGKEERTANGQGEETNM